jgi:hypothetical protein
MGFIVMIVVNKRVRRSLQASSMNGLSLGNADAVWWVEHWYFYIKGFRHMKLAKWLSEVETGNGLTTWCRQMLDDFHFG